MFIQKKLITLKEKIQRFQREKVLVIASMGVIAVFGLLMLYSVSAPEVGLFYVERQSLFMAVGVGVAVILRRMDYRLMLNIGWLLLIGVGIPLAALAVICLMKAEVSFMPSIKGAYRWIKIGSISVQPSEFARPVMIIFMAWFFARYQIYVNRWRSRWFYIGLILPSLIIVLVLLGRDLSVSILSSFVFLAMLYVVGLRLRYFVLIFMAVAILAIGDYSLPKGSRLIMKEYRMERLTTYRYPEKYKMDETGQLWRSMMALASGGMTGRGFSDSLLKYEYLPESHTDFILSVVGEELGFIGLATVFIGYWIFALGGLIIAARAPDYGGAFLAAGLTINLVAQGMFNLAVICGAAPTTGIPAPLISYGGSSVVATMISVGLLLSVERETGRRARLQAQAKKEMGRV